ncbi:MAG: CPBP family intramembrane metalloprotease [Sphingomonas sp.]|nr:CPBP family intramembrane metalloprotease [Sphingomonas sp.]
MLAASMALLLALGCYWLFLKGRLADRLGVHQRGRRASYLFWVAKSAALFVAPTLLILACLGALGSLIVMPPAFADAAWQLGVTPGGAVRDTAFLFAVVGGLIGGALLGAIVAGVQRKRGRRPWMIGDLRSILPATRAELPYAAGIAVAAGISEELFFRLLLPLLIGVLSGSALFGFAVSAVLFAGAHRYQGWKGMAGSAALSVIFTVFYWMTASLWMTMVLHMLVDLNGLVLRPLVLGLRASGDSRS